MPEQDGATEQPQESVAYVDPAVGGGNGSNIWQMIKSSKLLKIGLPLLLVALMPVVILLSQQKQEDKSHASAATTLSFSPSSSNAKPLTRATGSELVLEMNIDPGNNLLSTVKLDISYDPTKLELDEQDGFTVDKTAFPTVLEGPTLTPGEIQATLTIGSDPAKAIKKTTHVGRLKFKVIGPTDQDQVTLVKFNPTSTATSLAAQDQANENVLATTQPAAIQISGIAITSNDKRSDVKGEYVDKNGRPITIPGAQVVLYKQGSTGGTVSKEAPTWKFDNLKKGSYRIDAKMLAGYDLLMATCEGACKDGMKYTRDYSIHFAVNDKNVRVSVKYVPNGNTAAVPSQTVVADPSITGTTSVACSNTTADVNKDGKVDYRDQSVVASCQNTPSGASCVNADTNKDGKVDGTDMKCVAETLCSPTVADVNTDGKVDARDYQLVSSCYNQNAEGACASYDVNKSGRVDLEDLNCVQKQAPTPTPTP